MRIMPLLQRIVPRGLPACTVSFKKKAINPCFPVPMMSKFW
jgi:hypothetical protein